MKPVIAANWKMNLRKEEALDLFNSLFPLIEKIDINVIICPPACYLSLFKNENVATKLGAQNISEFERGAYTGEISAEMVKSVDAEYVIIGHSERRHVFNETNEMIRKKLELCNGNKLTPILCVGETLDQRKNNELFNVIRDQLSVVSSIDGDYLIAYEPVWAIGTGETATPEIAQEVHAFIRNELKNSDVPILYGGSVNPGNIEGLLSKSEINGALVGGASLKINDFSDILKKASSLERIPQ